MGNNLSLLELIRSRAGRVREAIAWWLRATGGYGVKLVNPGGVEMWKRDNGNVTSLDDERPRGHPAQVLETIATAVARARAAAPRAHPLQQPRRRRQRRTTLDTLRTLDGRRAHFAHLQFHGYGGEPGRAGRARGRPSSPSTSTRTRSSAPTSGR